MTNEGEKPYGYIYVATNRINSKVYVGQTITSQWGANKIPIEERWKREIKDAYSKKSRGENLRYIENAIIKYGSNNFDLKEVDTAQNQERLNEKENYWMKELDSLNPDKGYNVMEAGRGGELTQRVKDKMSESHEKKWQEDLEYKRKQINERQERSKNPEWLDKMANVNQEIARNPETLDKMSKSLSAKWKEKEYQENVSKGATDKWQEGKYRGRQFTARREGKREIPDIKEFLKDIQDMKKKDLNSKHDMDGKTMNKRIEGMLGHQGVKKFSQAKKYLEGKNLDEVLKDVKEVQNKQSQKFEGKKEISNIREFLEDIQNLKTKEIEQKYNMNRSTATKRVREMLGDKGVKNFTDTKEYLKDKDLDEVVKDINERLSDQNQRFEGKSVIENKREFLEDIQNLQKNEIDHKYGMDAKTINNKIKGILGEHGVKNYTDAKEYLKDKNLDDVLKEIEEKEAEKEGEKSETEESSEKSDDQLPETHPEEEKPSSDESGEDDQEEKTEDPEEKLLEEASRENERVSKDPQNPEVAEESTGTVGENSGEPELGSSKPGIGVRYRDHIDDKREFLNDIKSGMSELDITEKYNVSNSTMNLIIQDMFGENGPRTRTDLYYHLQNTGIDGALNEIKENEGEKRGEGSLEENSQEKVSITGGSPAESEESQINASSKDYEGINQIQADKGTDFKGIDEYDDDAEKDYNKLDDINIEKGSDFDGIDSPQEEGDKDYDDIDKEYPKAGVESGGEP